MKKIVLAGNSITAEILYGYLKRDTRYQVVAATVDDAFLTISKLNDLRSIGLSQLTKEFPPDQISIIMAMGYDDLNRGRESFFTRLKSLGYAIETYVHPDSCVYTDHPLGEGSVILPSAIIEPHVQIGANTFIWCNATVAHHSHVDDHCWIASGAVISGYAKIGHHTFVGVNATVVNEIAVGQFNIVGASALITKHTKDNSVHLSRSAEEWRYSAEDYAKYFGV